MKHYPPKRTGSHTGWSPGRDRGAQAKFRAALIARSGGQCEYVSHAGLRCTNHISTHRMEAHHDWPGYTPDCGRLLCAPLHHKAEDPHAR